MPAEAFFDTNILLYAGSSAEADAAKQRIAQDLLLNVPFAQSAQVLQEYIANALGKKSLGLTEENIRALLDFIDQIEVQPINKELVIPACQLRLRYQVSHWDATILAAGIKLGCKILCTEDLTHGQDYGGIRVFNPFL